MGDGLQVALLIAELGRCFGFLTLPDMKFLFVHQNFPGQYLHLVQHLRDEGHEVVFITQHGSSVSGIRLLEYLPLPQNSSLDRYMGEIETNVMNGLAVARLCEGLKRDGFVPDIVIGHCGWGEVIFVKDVWPSAPLLGYFEFFYRATGSDLDFDNEFPTSPDDVLRLRVRNTTNLLSLDAADWGQTPTQWQRDQYPERYRDQISVIHEGIDTERVRPEASARLWLQGGISLSRDDEVVTYSARNLEPYRGFHILMRALPRILSERQNARVLIVGSDGVSYGRRPPDTATWRQYMMRELGGSIDMSRVHFVGKLPYEQYLAVLQLSSVHVYLTYPFVLSWSLLEAMAAGCLVIGSRTPPVEEVMIDGKNGLLVDFFDVEGLADRVCSVLADRAANSAIREAARKVVVSQFDLKSACLPAHLALIRRLTGTASPPRRSRAERGRNKAEALVPVR